MGIHSNSARAYSKLYIFKMGNGCKKPVKNIKSEEPVEAKEQVNDPQDQNNNVIEKQSGEVVESPIVVEEAITGGKPPSAKEEKIKTETEDTLKENIVVSRLKSMPVANSSPKEKIRKPSLQYDTPLKTNNEITTVTMSESDTALKQKLFLGEDVELQYHNTKIFDHSLQVYGQELSEVKEITEITVLEGGFEKYLGNIILHSRSIGNRKLDIITENTDNNEVIGHTLKTFVRNDQNCKSFTRAMSSTELKKFRKDWNRLWKPSFTDIELQQYALKSSHMDESIPKNQIIHKTTNDVCVNHEKSQHMVLPEHELKEAEKQGAGTRKNFQDIHKKIEWQSIPEPEKLNEPAAEGFGVQNHIESDKNNMVINDLSNKDTTDKEPTNYRIVKKTSSILLREPVSNEQEEYVVGQTKIKNDGIN